MTKYVNRYYGSLVEFIKIWDGKGEFTPSNRVHFPRSPAGNINKNGSCSCCIGECLTCNHPQFLEGIEFGVIELVRLVVFDFGFITYTSCEGHDYRLESLKSVPRHVGILPRNTLEADKVRELFLPIIAAINAKCLDSTVKVALIERELVSDDGTHLCQDLWFGVKPHVDWIDYFGDIEPFYKIFLSHLALLLPDTL